MTRNEFIKFLQDNNVDYKEGKDCGWPVDSDVVYAYGQPETIFIPFFNQKDVYTPYLRVSHFEGRPGMCYVRDNGFCTFMADGWIKRKCLELRDRFKEEN